jgi:hypothetical protein
MSLTTDPNSPCINKPKGDGQQNECYLILSEEERAKGFIRPVRTNYIHVGKTPHYQELHKMLDEEERKEYPKYVAIMKVLSKEDGSYLGGAYVTQKELDDWKSGERTGGCGTRTTMAREIAETYARNPKYYGSTWCMGCKKHIDVGEFIWDDGSNEIVGS